MHLHPDRDRDEIWGLESVVDETSKRYTPLTIVSPSLAEQALIEPAGQTVITARMPVPRARMEVQVQLQVQVHVSVRAGGTPCRSSVG